jgi:hypothetical protein
MAGVAAVNVTNVSEQAGRRRDGGTDRNQPRARSAADRDRALALLHASVGEDGTPAFARVAAELQAEDGRAYPRQTLHRWWKERDPVASEARAAEVEAARSEVRSATVKGHFERRVARFDELREKLEKELESTLGDDRLATLPPPKRMLTIEAGSRLLRNLQQIEEGNAALLARDQGAEGEKKADPDPEAAKAELARLAASLGLQVGGQPPAANDDYDPETAKG